MTLTTKPVPNISGIYTPPGDKSISHRLTMLCSLAQGESKITNFLNGEDCLSTIKAFQAMGVAIELSEANSDSISIHGVGLKGLKPSAAPLDMGNSGTTTRLLIGILAGQDFQSKLIGDESLSKRPMKRVIDPLASMGAIFGETDILPISIHGAQLKGIEWNNTIGSAQIKSAILLAGLYADGVTTINELIPTRDHTERLLELMGAPINVSNGSIQIEKTETLRPVELEVPGDFSSAAFMVAAALITPGSALTIRNVGVNPTRIGMLDVLREMGADIQISDLREEGEPVATLQVKHSQLKAVHIGGDIIPRLIDELPILMVLMALAEGESVISGAKELRVKESDRIKSMAGGFRAIGIEIEEREDGCVIQGVEQFEGGEVESFKDHRIAMSFAIAGLCSKVGVTVKDSDCIAISYPNFEDDLKAISSS